MTDKRSVQQQLKRTGSDFRFWGRSEANELPNILFPNEQIMHALNGSYEKGFGLFCATDQRLLLLDKKPLILCFEDMRYEMVSEVDYTEELLSATVTLKTPGRTLRFRSFRINRLRQLTNFIQARVSHVRHLSDQSHHNYPEYHQPNYETYLDGGSPQPEYQQAPQAPIQPFAHPRNPYANQAISARRRVPKFSPPQPPQTSNT